MELKFTAITHAGWWISGVPTMDSSVWTNTIPHSNPSQMVHVLTPAKPCSHHFHHGLLMKYHVMLHQPQFWMLKLLKSYTQLYIPISGCFNHGETAFPTRPAKALIEFVLNLRAPLVRQVFYGSVGHHDLRTSLHQHLGGALGEEHLTRHDDNALETPKQGISQHGRETPTVSGHIK